MNRIDEPTAKALYVLKNAQELEAARTWLLNSLIQTDHDLRTAEGNALLRLQGEAQCLERILRGIDQSRSLLDKMKQ